MVTSLQHADLLAWAHSGLKSIQADSAPNWHQRVAMHTSAYWMSISQQNFSM